MPITLDWSGWDVEATEAEESLAFEPELLPPIGDDTTDETVTAEPLIGGDTPDETATAGPVEEREALNVEEDSNKEPSKPFPLKAKKPKRLDKRTLDAVTRAFKLTVRRCGFSYHVGYDEQGRPRVVLSGKQGGLALLGLEIKLDQTPELEAFLLLELAQKDADLRFALDERAAIRAADGLSDDDMTVALVMIGADERMAEMEAERAEFEATLQLPPC